jgi:hypothetical protein
VGSPKSYAPPCPVVQSARGVPYPSTQTKRAAVAERKGANDLAMAPKLGMPFSDESVRQAWDRSGGRCECRRESHGHGECCGQSLLWTLRGAAWALAAGIPSDIRLGERTSWRIARSHARPVRLRSRCESAVRSAEGLPFSFYSSLFRVTVAPLSVSRGPAEGSSVCRASRPLQAQNCAGPVGRRLSDGLLTSHRIVELRFGETT